jgi:metal-responsive CopG/Arc/MetJ family transcriptional regulator
MEKQNVALRFPKELLDEVDEYQKQNNITTRSSAIYELIRKGLKQSDNREG